MELQRVRSQALRAIRAREAAGEVTVEVRHCGARALGYGLFAARHLAEGEWLLEYAGERKRVRWDTLESADARYMWELVGGVCGEGIDAASWGNAARFMNHYDGLLAAPNVASKLVREADGLHVAFQTSSAVRAGDQLLIDYGPHFQPGADSPCSSRAHNRTMK